MGLLYEAPSSIISETVVNQWNQGETITASMKAVAETPQGMAFRTKEGVLHLGPDGEWRFPLGDHLDVRNYHIAVDTERVFALQSRPDGIVEVVGLATSTGDQIWRAHLEGKVIDMVQVDDVVLVAHELSNRNQVITVLRCTNGDALDQGTAMARVDGAPWGRQGTFSSPTIKKLIVHDGFVWVYGVGLSRYDWKTRQTHSLILNQVVDCTVLSDGLFFATKGVVDGIVTLGFFPHGSDTAIRHAMDAGFDIYCRVHDTGRPGTIVVSTAPPTQEVIALDLHTGQEIWKIMQDDEMAVARSVVTPHGLVMKVLQDDFFHSNVLLDPTTGQHEPLGCWDGTFHDHAWIRDQLLLGRGRETLVFRWDG